MQAKKESVTIYDVAREAGVSMATVSRVVNGNPNVKDKTRQKVLGVIERLDYRPNAVARGLASKRTTTIGVVIPTIANAYYATLAKGINDIADMYDYNIILTSSDESDEKAVQVIQSLLSKQIDGIIYMGDRLSTTLRDVFKQHRIPVVLAGTLDTTGELPSVNVDYEQAAQEVTTLLAATHDTIALVTGPLTEEVSEKFRLKGYKAGLKAKNKPFSEDLVFECSYSYQAGFDIADRILASGATAAYVIEDQIAAGLLNALHEKGVRVPEDFEIVAARGTQITQYTYPNLTHIHQPIYDIGAVSMRILTKIMLQEEVGEHQITLAYGINKRGTTK